MERELHVTVGMGTSALVAELIIVGAWGCVYVQPTVARAGHGACHATAVGLGPAVAQHGSSQASAGTGTHLGCRLWPRRGLATGLGGELALYLPSPPVQSAEGSAVARPPVSLTG